MRFLAFWATALPLVAGCGLTIDYDPPDDGGVIGFDARPRSDGSTAGACATDHDCDDGDPCNGRETCDAEKCVDGAAPECADSIACTVDSCDSAQGCAHTPDDTLCEDDGIECTVERCDPSAGCQRERRHAACDDGIACTDDVCDPDAPGGCRHDPIGSRCGVAVCDPTLGCVGTECVGDDDCVPGPCESEAHCEAGACLRTTLSDGTSCDDGNPCTQTSACMGGACRGIERTACPGQPCVVCNPLGGGCDGSRVAPVTTACDDGDMCTHNDSCDGSGSCAAPIVTACGGSTMCTLVACNPSTGLCEASELSGSCNDGNACTNGDFCSGGVCVGATAIDCSDDGNPCTSEMCDPASGACVHPPVGPGISCEGRDLCTINTTCQPDGSCGGGAPRCPDDPSPCIQAVCNPSSALCGTLFPEGALCLNGACSGGECACRAGFQDCNDDGSCECDRSSHFCDSAGQCQPYRTCGACATGEACCPCTGACVNPDCLSCCMFCPAPVPAAT